MPNSSTVYEVMISELPAASQANAGDQLEANQSGTSRSITIDQVATHVASSGQVSDVIDDAIAEIPPPDLSGYLPVTLGPLYAETFGVTIGTTTDQSVALQAAIDAAEAQKRKLVLPAGYIRIDATIYVGRVNPVWIEGQQPHAFGGFTGNEADDATVLHCANLPSNVPAVELAAITDTRDGITFNNITVLRPVPSVAGAGDTGILIKGITKANLNDIAISGFDKGLHCSINSTGTRATYLSNFRNVRINLSGNYAGLIESCVDCLFDHCWFGGATIAGMAITLPSIITASNTKTNGNYWEHCTFIASQGTVPTNNVRIDCGFWNCFDTCAFEQAVGDNLAVNYTAAGADSGHTSNRVAVVLRNAWLNNDFASNPGNITVTDANFQLIGGRVGSTVSTGAAIKVAQSSFGIVTFDSCIMGVQIDFQSVAGITVAGSYENLRVVGCTVQDMSATGLPCIVVSSSTSGRCTFSGNRLRTTHTRGYTDAGELVGAGSIFVSNVLNDNTSSDSYFKKATGGPVLAFAGLTPKTTEFGISQPSAARLFTRHTNDTGGIDHYYYKTRQTAPGGAPASVVAGDGVSQRHFYADDGTTDQEVLREVVTAETTAPFVGGSWELFLRSGTTAGFAGRFKINNVGTATFNGPLFMPSHTINYYGTSAGTDALVATSTLAPLLFYAPGAFYIIKAGGTTTTGAPTLNISGLGAKTIVKRASTALAAGDIVTGMMCHFVYNGTNMQLMNPVVP